MGLKISTTNHQNNMDHNERSFRRGAAHGIEAAIKVMERNAHPADDSRAEAISDLKTLAQVVMDWRNGQTERNGYPGNPWEWSKADYAKYVETVGPTW